MYPGWLYRGLIGAWEGCTLGSHQARDVSLWGLSRPSVKGASVNGFGVNGFRYERRCERSRCEWCVYRCGTAREEGAGAAGASGISMGIWAGCVGRANGQRVLADGFSHSGVFLHVLCVYVDLQSQSPAWICSVSLTTYNYNLYNTISIKIKLLLLLL